MKFLALLLAAFSALSMVAAMPSLAALSRSDIDTILKRADVQELLSRRPKKVDYGPPQLTPDPNDTEHQFQEPGPTDQRGPCPGMNALANHGYIPRNGIATIEQLIDGQMKLYNLDAPLSALLALVAVGLDGDILSTKVSMGGKDDRTLQLGAIQNLLSDEPGLDGHNHFEGDASLTRQDYFMNNADNYSFDAKLFAQMRSFMQKYGKDGKYYDLNALGQYRAYRYNWSRKYNEHFIFGPPSVLMYGAASFVYETFGNATDGPHIANEASVNSFFGAVPDETAPHGFRHVAERVPPFWYRRADPFTIDKVGDQIGAMQDIAPPQYGFRTGGNDTGIFLNFTDPMQGLKAPTTPEESAAYCCAVTQAAYAAIPGTLSTGTRALRSRISWLLGALTPVMKNACDCGELDEPGYTSSFPGPVPPQDDGLDQLLSSLLPAPGPEARKAGLNAIHNALTNLNLGGLL